MGVEDFLVRRFLSKMRENVSFLCKYRSQICTILYTGYPTGNGRSRYDFFFEFLCR